MINDNITYFERTKQFLDSFNIKHTVNGYCALFDFDNSDDYPFIDKKDGSKEFYSIIKFDENGKFISVGS